MLSRDCAPYLTLQWSKAEVIHVVVCEDESDRSVAQVADAVVKNEGIPGVRFKQALPTRAHPFCYSKVHFSAPSRLDSGFRYERRDPLADRLLADLRPKAEIPWAFQQIRLPIAKMTRDRYAHQHFDRVNAGEIDWRPAVQTPAKLRGRST